MKELNFGYQNSDSKRAPGLDPVPFILTADDQKLFQAALNQFGRLLPLVHNDLWGPQTLVDDGAVPGSLLWEGTGMDPGFFHTQGPDPAPLSLIRMDLSPGPGGTWDLVSLGTQIPRGLGYALENRIVHSRHFGSLVSQENVVRLAPFFQGLKDLWFSESRTHQDDPSLMVWTSGPTDPDYFEPVYLARYFGYPLVESRDLTVRSGKVYLKTLGGLQPVDVLIRMVDDRFLDPLSGNPPGYGGVAGLMQAVRDGTVVVTNAPGTSLLENPKFLRFLSPLARRVLEEDLILSPTAPNRVGEAVDFHGEDGWTTQPITVRVFAARATQGWEMMPGGLVSGTRTGARKDLWILSRNHVAQVSLLPSRERPAEITRASELPSRVADDLYWLGRYVERAWNDLRYLEKWWELKQGSGAEALDSGASLIEDLLLDLQILPDIDRGQAWQAGRLKETLNEIQRISGQVLDRLSLETHRLLKDFGEIDLEQSDVSVQETLRLLGLRLAAFHGLTLENMTRTSGWVFLDLGRRLERASLIAEGLDGFFRHESGEENLTLLLEIFDSILTYRTRYRLSPQRGPVLDLLLLDEANPRSLAFQIAVVSRHIEALPRIETRAFRTVEERTVLDLLTRVRLCDAQEFTEKTLSAFVAGIIQGLEALSESLHQSYLAKIEPIEALQARQKKGPA